MIRKPQRPASVLVFAILQFIFGTICLFCNGINLGVAAIQANMSTNPAVTRGPNATIMDADFVAATTYPAYLPAKMAVCGFSLFLAVLMLLSGIGLLMTQKWGRWLTFAWAGLLVLACIGDLVIDISMRYPVFDSIANQVATSNPAQASTAAGWKVGFFFGIALKVLPAFVYLALIVFFLNRPNVRDAFNGIDRSKDDERDDLDHDRYDDRDLDRDDDRDRDRDRDDDRDRDRNRYDERERDRYREDDLDRGRGERRERDPDDRYR